MSKHRIHLSPEQKAKIVLEALREDQIINEVANKYGIGPQLLSRWKAEFIEKMPIVFDKKASAVEKLIKEHEAEKKVLINQIGRLSIDVEWLKKVRGESRHRDCLRTRMRTAFCKSHMRGYAPQRKLETFVPSLPTCDRLP